jgi:hypothetical protein
VPQSGNRVSPPPNARAFTVAKFPYRVPSLRDQRHEDGASLWIRVVLHDVRLSDLKLSATEFVNGQTATLTTANTGRPPGRAVVCVPSANLCRSHD